MLTWILRSCLTMINDSISTMSNNASLLSSLQDWNVSLNSVVTTLSDSVVKPVAYTILALFATFELYTMSQRLSSSGGGQQIGVQQMCISMAKIAICKWAIDANLTIMYAIFEISQSLTISASGYIGSGTVAGMLDVDALMGTIGTSIGEQLGCLIPIMLCMIIIKIVTIVISVVVTARFIELYVLIALSPIPLATFANSELRHIGTGFLKSFAAVAFQGFVLYIVIGFFPAVMSNMPFDTTSSATNAAWSMVGIVLVLAVAVFFSSAWAKKVFSAS